MDTTWPTWQGGIDFPPCQVEMTQHNKGEILPHHVRMNRTRWLSLLVISKWTWHDNGEIHFIASRHNAMRKISPLAANSICIVRKERETKKATHMPTPPSTLSLLPFIESCCVYLIAIRLWLHRLALWCGGRLSRVSCRGGGCHCCGLISLIVVLCQARHSISVKGASRTFGTMMKSECSTPLNQSRCNSSWSGVRSQATLPLLCIDWHVGRLPIHDCGSWPGKTGVDLKIMVAWKVVWQNVPFALEDVKFMSTGWNSVLNGRPTFTRRGRWTLDTWFRLCWLWHRYRTPRLQGL